MATWKFGTDEWLTQAKTEIATKRCPHCDVTALSVDREFIPSETFSLAGQQPKLSGRFEIILRCGDCKLVARLHED